ncbi:hepatic sodium/bile acid cotransporter-like isoform X1 [Apostichopus japonicus]
MAATVKRIYMLAIFTIATTKCIFGEFAYSFSPPNLPILIPGVNRSIELSMTGITEDVLVLVESTNPQSVRILGDSSFALKKVNDVADNPTSNTSVTVSVSSVYVGISDIRFDIKTRDIFSESPYQVDNYTVTASIGTETLKLISTYILLVWLIISYVTMGTKITWSAIKPKLYRPHGILIGIACQFIIMPGLSFLLAKAMNLDPTAAVGIVIEGSCPGGWLSNVFTALLDCDLVLSLTMTFCSTILALGFMPLNMFIYSTPFTKGDESLKTPFLDIFTQLSSLVIPVFVGILITYKFPKFGNKLSKLIKPFATIIIIISLGLGIPANWYVLQSPFSIWIASALLPLIGGLLGLIIAKITCLPNRSAVTVSFETGAQNSFLAISMATLSYPQPASALIGRPPLLVAFITMIEGTIVVVIYLLMTKYPGKPNGGEEKESYLIKKTSNLKQLNHAQVGGAVGNHVAIQTNYEDIQRAGTAHLNQAYSKSIASISGRYHYNDHSMLGVINGGFEKHYV